MQRDCPKGPIGIFSRTESIMNMMNIITGNTGTFNECIIISAELGKAAQGK